MKKLVLIICLLLFPLITKAQNWNKTNMPDTVSVTCITFNKINDNFIGTNKGLYNFSIYNNNDYWTQLLENHYINNIKQYLKYSKDYNFITYFCTDISVYEFLKSGYQSYGFNHSNCTSIAFNKDSIAIISSIGDTNTGGVQKMDLSLQSGWRPMNSGLPIVNDSIKAYDIINKNDTLYVGLSNGLYYSIDDGKHWLPVSEFDGYKIDHFVLNSKNDLFFVVNGTDNKAGVYKNFKKYFGDILPISSIAVNRNDNVFIGTSLRGRGVFYTDNDGDNWIEYYDGLDSAEITALAVDTSGIVYAGTNGQGIYKRQFPTTGISEISFKNNLSIFPNPFSNKTTIQYSISKSQNVKLSVYNAFGEQVAILVNEFQESGTQEAVFNAVALPSGAYYFVLQTGNRIQSGRLMLIK